MPKHIISTFLKTSDNRNSEKLTKEKRHLMYTGTNKKQQQRLSVFDLACKEFGSHHFVLIINKKLNILNNKNYYWIFQRNEVTGQTIIPQIEETDRQLEKQIITTYQSRNPQGETSMGTSTHVGKPKL